MSSVIFYFTSTTINYKLVTFTLLCLYIYLIIVHIFCGCGVIIHSVNFGDSVDGITFYILLHYHIWFSVFAKLILSQF